MIYIPLKHLQPGMIIARDISCSSAVFSLLVEGQQLSPSTIRKLEKYDIPGAYIKSDFCDDVEVKDVIDPVLKQHTLSEIKSIFNACVNQKPLFSGMLDSISALAEDLIMSILSQDECLFNVIDIKEFDTYTYTHSMYVCILSVLMGIRLNLPRNQLVDLAIAGLLHDIGKLDIPLEIVNKPGQLTQKEFKIMQLHPEKAVLRLRHQIQVSPAALAGVGSHHEKYDGSGYPRGLAGENIPLYGRILALADVYDALTSCRSYRRAWPSNEVIEYMMGCVDTHFDHNLLCVFLQSVAAYPVGTIVKLSNEYVGVVTKNSPENTLRPTVRILLPEEMRDKEIELSSDMNYLNVTIIGLLADKEDLPLASFGL